MLRLSIEILTNEERQNQEVSKRLLTRSVERRLDGRLRQRSWPRDH